MGYLKMGIWLAVTVFLIVRVHNKPERMVPVCLIYFFITVINDIFISGVLELANAFGFSYQLADLMLIVFAATLVISVVKKPFIRGNFPVACLMVITLLMLFSMLNGLLSFGITEGWFGDIRTLLLFLFALLWCARFFKIEYLDKNIRLLYAVMMIIAVISISLWTIDIGFGIHPFLSQYGATLSDGGSTMRFVQPYEVLGIALYALYLSRKSIKQTGVLNAKAIFFLTIVIIFQHRSIWMSLALGVATIIISELKTNKNSVKLFMQVGLIAVFAVAFMMFNNGAIVSNISNSWSVFIKLISGTKIENSTAATRALVWNAVLEDLSGISAFIGRPFGYGYASSIGWTTSPHSGYVRLVARIGYFGILSLIFVMVWVVIKSIKKTPYVPEFVICVMGFMYGYDCTWICGAIIGATLSVIYAKKTAEVCIVGGIGH